MAGESEPTQNPKRNGLLHRLRAIGIEDAVMAALESGQTLRAVHGIIAARGISTTLPAIHDLKTRHLAGWVSGRVMAEAKQEGVDADTLADAVRALLLAKVGRVVTDATGADQVKAAVGMWADFTRAAVACRADDRAERESQRKMASRIEDLLADAERLEAVKKARDAVSDQGHEARLNAIIRALWPEIDLSPAA